MKKLWALVKIMIIKSKTNITESTYNVNERIANAEGNQVNNPKYDADKSGKKKLKLLFR